MDASGKRKEDVLKRARRQVGLHAKVIERAGTANATMGEQNEAIANPLGVKELVDRENQRSSAGHGLAKQRHHFTRLLEIEAIKWFIHEQHGMRRQKSKRPHQPPGEALRQGAYPLWPHRPEPDGAHDVINVLRRSAVDAGKEGKHPLDILIAVWPHAIWKIENMIAPMRERLAAPENIASVNRQNAGDRFEQGRLAGAIGPDEPKRFARLQGKAYFGESDLMIVMLCERHSLKQRSAFRLMGRR
jgi:hypothetical protein